MHAIHPDPRLLLAALVALVLAVVALAAAPTLSDLELGGGGAPVAQETQQPVKGPVPPPAWAQDPLAPPALLR